jgi:hypothetical protein
MIDTSDLLLRGIECLVEVYHNPCRTDWESFKTDLSGCLGKMTDEITNSMDLEVAAKQFQDAVVFAYEENFPLSIRRNNRNVPWWN